MQNIHRLIQHGTSTPRHILDYTYYKQHGEYETQITKEGLPGPRSKGRRCTDPISLCVFLAFIACWIGVVAFSMVNGDPYRAINGVDSFGNVCGRSNDDEFAPQGNYFLDMQPFPFLYCECTHTHTHTHTHTRTNMSLTLARTRKLDLRTCFLAVLWWKPCYLACTVRKRISLNTAIFDVFVLLL